MSADRDHHYVPQFHLRKWCDIRGNVMRWGRVAHTAKLTSKLVAPAATAYVPGLYALKHVQPERVHFIEEKVFGAIETRAAPILEKIVAAGSTRLSAGERYWWAVYIHSTIIRVPHVVSMLSEKANELLRQVLSEPDDEFTAAKGDAPERTLLEWAENHAPARLANSGLSVLVDLVGNNRAINRLQTFQWFVRDVSQSRRPLLLGDDPLERIGDLYKPNCLVCLPLTPSFAFFATNSPQVIDHIGSLTDRAVVNSCNVSTVTTAKKFVYGDAEPSFVDRHFPRPIDAA